MDVRVAYGDYPNQPPSEVFLFLVDSPDLQGHPWHDDAFVAELEPLVWAESPAAGGAAAMAALKRLRDRGEQRDERFLRTREELES